ncbi:mechanosensitive ion channel domain-containing protein, partial [Verrucomicrobiota bacterium]
MKRISTAIVLVLACCSGAFADDVDYRVKQAEEELHVLQRVAETVTNVVERANWDKRVKLAEKSLAHAKRLVALEQKQKNFASSREMGVHEALQRVIAAVETDTDSPKRQISERNGRIRDLKSTRADVEKRIAAGTGGRTYAQKVELDGRIRNIDAEILANMLARDADDLGVRLANEAQRIDQMRRSVDVTARITIRTLLEKKEGIVLACRNCEEFDLLREKLVAHEKETQTALSLARERFAQLDEEIKLLADQLQIERPGSIIKRLWKTDSPEVKRLNEMLVRAKSEKTLLAARIKHLEAQTRALNRHITLVDQGLGLFRGEQQFTEYQLSIARGRYLRYIATPFIIVLALVLIYKIVSHIIFPRIFKQDHLFVARRLGTYTLMLLIVLVITVSFLEDLKAIATVMGIVGAAIVIALQDLCCAFAGWFVIVASGKLRVGDRVEIDGHRGDVIDIQILRTVLLELNNWLGVDEPTDRTVMIPNSFVFKSQVFNYSNVHPYIWGKADIIVTFESDPVAAKELLMKILEEETKEEFEKAQEAGPLMEERYGKRRTDYKPKIHTVVADSGLVFSLHYVTHYTRFAETR